MRKQKRRQKQVLSIMLGIAVSMANIMPITATTIGKPSSNEKGIKIKFEAGDGGYFSENSDADESYTDTNASKSNAERTEWVQIFHDLEKDDHGYFTNLSLGSEEVEGRGKEPVWENIRNKRNENEDTFDDLAFAGWYYENDGDFILVSDVKEIYSDITLKAGWYNPRQIKGEIAEDYDLTAIGLGERNLISYDVKTERNAEELAELAEQELFEKELGIDGNGVFAVDLELSGRKKKVTITLNVPGDKLDPEKPISVIHEMDNGKVELISADVVKADDGNTYRMTFTVDSGYSFYFVNTCGLDELAEVSNPYLNYVDLAEDQITTLAGTVGGEFGDKLTWELKDYTLTISGTGAMPDWEEFDYASTKPWNQQNRKIETIIIKDGITHIGNYAFAYNKNLTDVTLSDSVTDIGEGAFRISGLSDITLSNNLINIGDSAFFGCNKLTDIKFPDGLVSISAGAFVSCNELINIEIPNSVTKIGERAFSSCIGLTNIKLSKGITTINNKTFNNCTALTSIEIPDNVTIIAEDAFNDCSNLASIKLPKGMTNIKRYTFHGCTGLTSIEIPDNVTNISGNAFRGCSNLASIKLSKGMTTINEDTFNGCTGLTSIEIPDNITSIDGYAFRGCSNLASIKLSKGMTTIKSNTFNGCTGLTSIEIPDNIIDISRNAFRGCSNLTSIKLSKGMTTIKSGTFNGCTSLTSIEIPDNITRIESRAFYETAISSVVIPESVVFLGQMSFPEETKIIYKRLENLTVTPLKITGNTNFIKTNNKHCQDYSIRYWASAINSYLYEGENGTFYRVEYENELRSASISERVIVEQYNSDYTFIKSWNVPKELSKFGGFYAGNDYMYMVFGQDNPKENNDAEVIRIVKYSKEMERLDSVSLYGVNTVSPFDASSLRMEENGGYLYIRTGHKIYKTSDGLNHQSNMTIVVNTEGMILSYCGFSALDVVGFVSHSFNQFIKIDGDTAIAVDHGDANPRGIVMYVFSANDVNKTANDLNQLVSTMLLSVPGNHGDNYTGICIGGFEVSDSSYLVAGNSINLDKFSTSKTRNVFLSVVNKNDLTSSVPEYIQVTNYEEGGPYSASNPQLVKISDELFAVMWEEMPADGSYSILGTNDTVKIAFFDGEGKSLDKGNIGSFTGCLSDCQPILLNGCVTWYVTDGDSLTFFSYPAEHPSSINDINVNKVILGKNNSDSGSGGSSSGSGESGSSSENGGGSESSGSSSGNGGSSGNSNSSGGSSGGSGGSGSSGGSGGSGGGGGGSRGGSSGGSSGSGGPGSGSGSGMGFVPVVSGTWMKDAIGWWLEEADKSYPRNQWAQVNGVIYHFNDTGYMTEGWYAENGRWYYLIPGNGAMATGWIQLAGTWYYLNADGAMATGWIQLAGTWYYLNANGAMAIGWIQDPNSRKWYYLGADGAMLVNTITPDNCVIGADGAWIQ